ncbi:MAG TPA: DUF3307 domain-containing protein [Candidatus Acidoferrales bacterium]|jgi:hypothetical protein|nr:DUF3307 domain-containing protein [Candidatus Acidoferrales bacterium]
MVHVTYDLFLAIYLAHLLGDFVFQTDRIAAGKKAGRWQSYLVHGLTHYAAILAIVWTVNPRLFWTGKFHGVALSVCAIHLLLDWAKSSLTKAQWIPDNIWAFVVDQAAHLATIASGTFVITHPPLQLLAFYLQEVRAVQNKLLLVAVIYVLSVFGGGYFIRYLIAPLWKETDKESSDEVRNAGLYIGWMERFLVLTAIFLQSPGTIGLIFAAKSIARYPEMQSSSRFVEYFLIGTLLSITIAIGGALILLKVFYGTIVLGK